MSETDRIAIVTGTSSGIGAALVDGLLAAGWEVIGFARRAVTRPGGLYQHVEADLADGSALTAAAEHIAAQLQGRDWARVGLVNNAATLGDPRGLSYAEPDALQHLFAVNVTAPMVLAGVVVRTAPASAWLRIVNVSSGVATRAVPGMGDYGTSKAALRMAGMTLAAELASPDRPGGPRARSAVLSYEPGVVDTEMQVRARSAPREEAPWNQMFVDFAAKGALQPAQAVVSDVKGFLEGTSAEPFTEKRFSVR